MDASRSRSHAAGRTRSIDPSDRAPGDLHTRPCTPRRIPCGRGGRESSSIRASMGGLRRGTWWGGDLRFRICDLRFGESTCVPIVNRKSSIVNPHMLLLSLLLMLQSPPDELLTVAESSGYTETA